MNIFKKKTEKLSLLFLLIFLIILGCKNATEPDSSVKPEIIYHPGNASVYPGQTATFSVTAIGTEPLVYVWTKNNVQISGAADPGYTTPVTVLGDSGSMYTCIVSNNQGQDTSNPALLSVSMKRVVLQNGLNNYTGCKDAAIKYSPTDSTLVATNFGSDSAMIIDNCQS